EVPAFEFAKRPRYGLASGTHEFGNLLMRERKLDLCSRFGWLSITSPREQKSSHFFGCGRGKSNAAELFASPAVEDSELFHNTSVHLGRRGEQVKEIFPPNEGDLARVERFRRNLVRSLCENGHEAEDFAGLGNAQDQGSSRAGANRKLHFAGAKHKH